MKAIGEVSTALCCTVFITKVSRCSSLETDCADFLSKNKLQLFRESALKILHKYDMEDIPVIEDRGVTVCPTSRVNSCSISSGGPVPSEIIDWLSDPKPDRFLGHRILEEMAKKGIDLMGYSLNI